MRPGGSFDGVFANGQSNRSSRCYLRKRYPLWGKRNLAGISTGAWLDIEREHGGAHRGQAGAGSGRTGIFLLVKPKRRRSFAKWRYGMKAKAPGEFAGGPHEQSTSAKAAA